MTRFVCTANHGFAPYAIEELRRLFPYGSFRMIVPGEVFELAAEDGRDGVLAKIRQAEPVFLRHIQPVDRALPVSGRPDDLEALAAVVRDQSGRFAGKRTAVHIRRKEGTPFPFTVADTKAAIDAALREVGAEPALQSPDLILSVFAGEAELLVGIGTAEEMLSDWPGGAIRFRREDGQISRAKFKLLEAERAFGLRLDAHERALDIGAAPGGWTSLLLERGLDVTAVDPADLHPSLVGHPRVTWLKRNAGDVSFAPGTFDLLVCDMSWDPATMAKLVLRLAPSLKAGAEAIVTVKLLRRKPMQTIRNVTKQLGRAFDIRRAKQLFHNREEITLYLVYRGEQPR
jgi:23S rRNA (cytidine2498-2'-O)-methyltransferase